HQQQGDEQTEHHRERDVHEAEHDRAPQDGPEVVVVEDLAEVVEADPRSRLSELLLQPELLERHHAEAEERVAEHEGEGDRGRQQHEVGNGTGPPATPADPYLLASLVGPAVLLTQLRLVAGASLAARRYVVVEAFHRTQELQADTVSR